LGSASRCRRRDSVRARAMTAMTHELLVVR
jgi:hypothetical protein